MSVARSLGKRVGEQTYIHVSCLDALAPDARHRATDALRLAQKLPEQHFNVVKIDERLPRVSLLNYPAFFDDAFPELREVWTVDVAAGQVLYRSYADSLNPPILHRKELLLSLDDPRRWQFEEATKAAEAIGLFDGHQYIGFRQTWEKALRTRGFTVRGNHLVPLANCEDSTTAEIESSGQAEIGRHLTALSRTGFSAPVHALARHGLVTAGDTFFDYGCGRGDDVRGLRENGINAAGWDPHYFPEDAKRSASVVNLGFVLNVIEEFEERVDALRQAYVLAERVLSVSVMLANQSTGQGRPYKDGVLTQRNTFQKYYEQAELSGFIAAVLDEEPVPVAPGVFFVFKDKDAEQRFLANRQRSTGYVLRARISERRRREPAPRAADIKYSANKELLDELWDRWLELGRAPQDEEIPRASEIAALFGSVNKAFRVVSTQKDGSVLDLAAKARTADITVHLALSLFSKRKPYGHLEPGLQRDVRAFFSSYGRAMDAAKGVLYSISDPQRIFAACTEAIENGVGSLDGQEALYVHTSLVERLPVILRVYVGCGASLYGDIQNADLLKIHVRSGKLTFMKFDDYLNTPLPKMVERVKVNLKKQAVDVFQYGEAFPPPYLYCKAQYMNEEMPFYEEQTAFDATLDELKVFDFSGYGPSVDEFDRALARARWQVDGFSLVRARSVPELDEPCSPHFTYRQLIECGETRSRLQLQNLPAEPDTYTALHELATKVLEPVVDYYGPIVLTFGFCSSELARRISGHIEPKLDQHASHERKRTGTPVCPRLGAAVDFLVEDENMLEVAEWVAANTDFDRLYYYGPDRPVHVSIGPEAKREFVEMSLSATGKLIPRVRRTQLESRQGV